MASDAAAGHRPTEERCRTPWIGVLCYTLDPPTTKLLNRMAQMPGIRVKAFPLVFHPYVEPVRQYSVRPTRFRGRFVSIHNRALNYPDVQLFSLSLGTVWALVRDSDVVVLFGIHSIPAILSALLARAMGRPIVTCCLCLPPQVELERPRIILWLKKLVFRLTAIFVSESAASRATLKAVYRIPDERIVDAPFESGGVLFKKLLQESEADPEATRRSLGLGPDSCGFLFTGSLNHLKGVDVLLGAAALLIREGKDVRVVVVGADGAPPHGCRSTLEQQASTLGIADRVHFLGRLPTEEWVTTYRAADVFVLPTRRDMWGKVLTEAALAGLPLITTEVCAAAHDLVRDGINGFVVPVNSATALAEAMARLLDPELRARMGAKAREIVHEYVDADAETRGYHQAFARALGLAVGLGPPGCTDAAGGPRK